MIIQGKKGQGRDIDDQDLQSRVFDDRYHAVQLVPLDRNEKHLEAVVLLSRLAPVQRHLVQRKRYVPLRLVPDHPFQPVLGDALEGQIADDDGLGRQGENRVLFSEFVFVHEGLQKLRGLGLKVLPGKTRRHGQTVPHVDLVLPAAPGQTADLHR